jgi:hypothetical protein
MLSMFVKSIQIDGEKRVVVHIQDLIAEHLLKDESKIMLKEMAEKALESDFVKLEVSKTSFRVTVAEGTEDASKRKIEAELLKFIEMAMSFMSQMDNKEE